VQFKELAGGIDFEGVAFDLQSAINGVWVGSNEYIIKSVMFSQDGDLILESSRGNASKLSIAPTVPFPSANVAVPGQIGIYTSPSDFPMGTRHFLSS
jgi:hypothetical protein